MDRKINIRIGETLPQLIKLLPHTNELTNLLLKWQIHTIVRCNQACQAQWDEIDFEQNVWTIPSCKTKNGIKHRVPLTSQTLAILDTVESISGHNKYIFSSNHKSFLSLQTLDIAIKRIKSHEEITIRELRSLTYRALHNLGVEPEIIQAVFSYAKANNVLNDRKFNDFEIPQRTMQLWSNHIDPLFNGNLPTTLV